MSSGAVCAVICHCIVALAFVTAASSPISTRRRIAFDRLTAPFCLPSRQYP